MHAWMGLSESQETGQEILISSTCQRRGPCLAGSICTNGVRITGSIPIWPISCAPFSASDWAMTLDPERGKDFAEVTRQNRMRVRKANPAWEGGHLQAREAWMRGPGFQAGLALMLHEDRPQLQSPPSWTTFLQKAASGI